MQTLVQKFKSISPIISLTCMVHCLIAPLVIVIAPAISESFHNIYFEIFLLFFSIACGIYIIHNGVCSHKKKHTWFIFSAGAFLWCLNIILDHTEFLGSEFTLLILGSLFVLLSYYINHRYLKCCSGHSCS